jgi:hypothetical protein
MPNTTLVKEEQTETKDTRPISPQSGDDTEILQNFATIDNTSSNHEPSMADSADIINITNNNLIDVNTKQQCLLAESDLKNKHNQKHDLITEDDNAEDSPTHPGTSDLSIAPAKVPHQNSFAPFQEEAQNTVLQINPTDMIQSSLQMMQQILMNIEQQPKLQIPKQPPLPMPQLQQEIPEHKQMLQGGCHD